MGLYKVASDLENTPQLYFNWATLIRVKDGDTAVVRKDLGHGVYFDCTIRLEGYNAPELFRPKNLEEKNKALIAKKELKILLENNQPFLTQTIYTERVPRGKKSFDRWRSHIWIKQNNRLISVAKLLTDLSIRR